MLPRPLAQQLALIAPPAPGPHSPLCELCEVRRAAYHGCQACNQHANCAGVASKPFTSVTCMCRTLSMRHTSSLPTRRRSWRLYTILSRCASRCRCLRVTARSWLTTMRLGCCSTWSPCSMPMCYAQMLVTAQGSALLQRCRPLHDDLCCIMLKAFVTILQPSVSMLAVHSLAAAATTHGKMAPVARFEGS